MGLLRKLIVKEWVRSFFASVFILFLLVSVAQLVSGLLRNSPTAWEVGLDYLLDIPRWLGRILPVCCLTATLFSLNRIRQRNELVSILAAGLSARKVVLTLLQVSAVVAGFQLLNAWSLQPLAKKWRHQYAPTTFEKFRHNEKMGLKTTALASGQFWFKSQDYFFSYDAFDKKKERLLGVSVYYFNRDFKLEGLIAADRARFVGPNELEMKDGHRYLGLDQQSFPELLPFKQRRLSIRESAEDFKQIDSDISTLDPIRLGSFIWKLYQRGIDTADYQIMLYNKFVQALICLLFALIPAGVLFAPGRRQASMGRNIGFTFIFCLLYWFSYSFLLDLGRANTLPPLLAAFAIPLIFAAYLLISLRKRL